VRPDRKLVLIIIDGLTPGLLEAALDDRGTPALAALAQAGRYTRAVSTFPSLTPVCLSSIATGAHADVHEIPHLVWYDRDARRLVEYGSSFAAMRAAGALRTIRDAVFNMNELHLGKRAVTLFEALEDAGLTTAAVNMTCYRGRTRHLPTVPGLTRPAYGPKRFFYFNLFESDRTGAPLAVRNRSLGTVDAYAAAVGRWLVTRDGFDFLVYYLPDFDYASHARGPRGAHEALARADEAVGSLLAAAGGLDEFLERYAVIVCSDHGQTVVAEAARLEDAFTDVSRVVVTASNRAGMVYRLDGCPLDVRDLAERLDRAAAVETALFLEDGWGVARRESEELRFRAGANGWETSGDVGLLDYPDGVERAWAALRNPNAGEVLVSAPLGLELSDLAGGDHVGGGAHGSLLAGDSEVPVLLVGVPGDPRSITDLAPLVLSHFGTELPPYARALARAA
jgi:predicted AlkP superfamily pyrophosphatase or phosphodiesterase